jgi:hypothetical protein
MKSYQFFQSSHQKHRSREKKEQMNQMAMKLLESDATADGGRKSDRGRERQKIA